MQRRNIAGEPFKQFGDQTKIIVRFTGRAGCDIVIHTPGTYLNIMHKRAGEIRIITKEPFSDIIYYRNRDHDGWNNLLDSLDIVKDEKFSMLKPLICQRKKYVYMKETLTQLMQSCFKHNIKLSIVLKYDNYVIYNRKNIDKVARKLKNMITVHMDKNLSDLVIYYWLELCRYDYN
jgi:hypothetical protein